MVLVGHLKSINHCDKILQLVVTFKSTSNAPGHVHCNPREKETREKMGLKARSALSVYNHPVTFSCYF